MKVTTDDGDATMVSWGLHEISELGTALSQDPCSVFVKLEGPTYC